MSIRIVVGGIPNCGKSTLTASIYREMQGRGIDVGVHELDVFQNTLPCILGLESWNCRPMVEKGDWTNPLIGQAIDAFARDERRFVLGDLTGIIDSLVEKMVELADSAIVVGKNLSDFACWLNFFASQKISVIAKVVSCTDGPAIHGTNVGDFISVRDLQRKVLQNNGIRGIVDLLLSHYASAG